MTPYTQITAEARYPLSVLRMQGHTQAEMARILGRHPGTISRELQRNVWRCNGRGSVASRAQFYTNERRHRSRRNSQFSVAEWAMVESMLHEDYSPAQVDGWFARFDMELLLELQYFSDGGLSLLNVLRAATRFPARVFGSRTFGSLTVDHAADLVLRRDNPLTSARACQ